MRYWPISLLILSFRSFANETATQASGAYMFSFLALTTVCLILLMRTRNLHLQMAQRAGLPRTKTNTIESNTKQHLKTVDNMQTQSIQMVEQAPDEPCSKTTSSEYKQHLNFKDLLFIERFEAVVAKNYQLNTFNRAQAASQLAISERQLNRKLGLLTEENFSCYLRKYRLRQAICLMGKGLQVSQIGDRVGFSSATYFSSCFKTEYGKTVKQYEQQLRG